MPFMIRRRDGASAMERDSITMARRIIARRRSSKMSNSSTFEAQQIDAANMDNIIIDDCTTEKTAVSNHSLAYSNHGGSEFDLDCNFSEISEGPRSHTSSYDVHNDIHEEYLISVATETYGADHLTEKKSNDNTASMTAALKTSSAIEPDSAEVKEMPVTEIDVVIDNSSDYVTAVQKLHDELKKLDDAIEELFSQPDDNNKLIRSSLGDICVLLSCLQLFSF